MGTPPTDAPFVNSDRTVGVRYDSRGIDLLKSLKRDALLFDQIALPSIQSQAVIFTSSPSDVDRARYREWLWLRDIGIVRELPSADFDRDDPKACRQYLDVLVAETGEPIDVKAIPDERVLDAAVGGFFAVFNRPSLDAVFAFVNRIKCINLRREGINAFPILESRRQIGNVFPSGTTPDNAPVIEIVLRSMPIPDDQTPWEDIIEFRNDPESMRRLRRLRVWTRKFAKATSATSLAEMKEEIEVLLDEYEEHMKLHRMKVNKGAISTLLTITGKLAEDLVKVKFGELAKLPFIFRERKIGLLEAEAKAPNRELAYISIARSRFSR